MSYNPYNQGGGYGGQSNPYDDRDDYNNGGNYGGYNNQGRTNQPAMEMQSMGNGGGNYGGLPPRPGTGPAAANPNNMLNECAAIDRAINDLDSRLQDLQREHRREDPDQRTIQTMNEDIMDTYRGLGDRLKKIKSSPDSGSPRNAPQVGRVDRRLKQMINDYQRMESDFRRKMQDQQARQYMIVNPDATDEEIREAVEDPNTQIFAQALMNTGRRGQANATLDRVRDRSAAIQNIEKQMIELAQLFQDLDNIVMEQEPLIQNIEQKGEEVRENVVQANEQLEQGVVKARSARKKKWICLGIVIAILIAIAVIIAVVVVINNNKPKPAAT
ncbi:t-SNARE [Aulographum hederae CBS 113979]|uniref:t-SNARE n=1 Tax=Aulographum hederae CBS 113979 TaxID=1176131 RepID=A0A6G1GLA1_9PEZI|nr:t-SNARE [Aulographum hederae CBS 113979]